MNHPSDRQPTAEIEAQLQGLQPLYDQAEALLDANVQFMVSPSELPSPFATRALLFTSVKGTRVMLGQDILNGENTTEIKMITNPEPIEDSPSIIAKEKTVTIQTDHVGTVTSFKYEADLAIYVGKNRLPIYARAGSLLMDAVLGADSKDPNHMRGLPTIEELRRVGGGITGKPVFTQNLASEMLDILLSPNQATLQVIPEDITALTAQELHA